MNSRAASSLWLIGLNLLGVGCTTLNSSGRVSLPDHPQVIVISIDGMTPDLYRDESLPTKNLQALARKGASAEGLIPIYPSLTYPNHTTMITGALSKEHGIVSNRIFSLKPGEEGPTNRWYFDANLIHASTLWDRVGAFNLDVATFNWPVSLGARARWVVPEIFPQKGFDMDQIWVLTEHATEPGLWADLNRATNEHKFTDTLQHDRWELSAARHIFKTQKPALTMLHLTHVDVTQHLMGPNTSAHRAAALELDRLIGTWIPEMDLEKNCLIVLGDHGFEEIRYEIRINDLFRSRGWITENSNGPWHWKVIADSQGGPAVVYAQDTAVREEALKVLRENQNRGHYRVIERDELDRFGAFPDALCAIEPDPSYAVAKELSFESAPRPLIRTLPAPHGEHGFVPSNPRMLSGFLAVGQCAQPGRNLGLVPMTDVAATIAATLGVPWPTTSGKPIPLSLVEPIANAH